MQRLRAAEYRRQSLQRGPHDVVVGLLRSERASRGLRMETERPRAGILRAVALGHRFMPDASRGAVFSDFFEEIAVGIEEKREARRKIVDVHAAAQCPIDILDSVAQSERQFL